ncbi:anaerobic sulfite reductase subunit AsrA [Clostridium chauvoei]|uniref:Anaerobic sulfite reductase subunit AsrA n=2 Tax=Clostridium chauvoei TaxID=46867 RepID=A0ABD4RIE2_9CLOT|nr:anaerobic sulfite reductase subunit AsrA [Clostridium chauvoei]ATD54524.1 anaerobic sulfite reductase subunit A [Clostridium chauvoei]ATD57794.1 anaerobic sulfite reductase subunit A [Clostridium chauvoei]MBX7281075.1 anaerobic sulfite reductase subunit AsrA [Clostridium chauvoei]MBX7283538.1 anaerobic sulfite reductase subunit AsrA [Clostridium chauvoei]MBX7286048.1 anaerobic sulfite reductase subunit AsrA [Clostridium chauvoei]
MGYKLNLENFNIALKELSKEYKIYAPKVLEGKGTFSDTDIVRYGEISKIEEIEFEKKSQFSYKEVLLPITQTLFFFTEDEVKEAKVEEKSLLIFLRSCDMHSLKRIDDIYLRNGFVDPYYEKVREKAKFILIGCPESFDNCFCVNMGTNKTDEYNAYVKLAEENIYLDLKDESLEKVFLPLIDENLEVKPDFVLKNEVEINIPNNLELKVMDSKIWNEYSERCIACGRCNFVCPTCTCFTMQDIFYKDNGKAGERRRVWASCQVDGYTDMAGGHSFRKDKGQRMRYKVLHKVYDYKKRWGYHMCVGCGRCDDICPEYISFSNCINKLESAMDEVK